MRFCWADSSLSYSECFVVLRTLIVVKMVIATVELMKVKTEMMVDKVDCQ